METNSNHSINDGEKTTEKTQNDSTKEIMDFYTKQLNVATGFYKTIFESFSTGNRGWVNTPDFSSGFLNSDLTKAFSVPFSGMGNNLSNPFMTTFDKLYKQMVEYNTTLFTNLTNGLKGTPDISEISKKYQDTVNTQIEASKNSFKNAADTYNKQLDFSIENNKKVMEDINNQFNVMVRQNQKFWFGLMSSAQVSTNNEEKSVTDSVSSEIKKRTAVPANQLSDHKV